MSLTVLQVLLRSITFSGWNARIRVTAPLETVALCHLEIQVSHIVTVEVLDSKQDLFDKEGSLLLSKPLSLSYKVEQFPAPQS